MSDEQYRETHKEIDSLVLQRLVQHLQKRTDVQNIDLMLLAGFCRNCLSNWYVEESEKIGKPMEKDVAKKLVYGMPYEVWKQKYQLKASAEKLEKLKNLK